MEFNDKFKDLKEVNAILQSLLRTAAKEPYITRAEPFEEALYKFRDKIMKEYEINTPWEEQEEFECNVCGTPICLLYTSPSPRD